MARLRIRGVSALGVSYDKKIYISDDAIVGNGMHSIRIDTDSPISIVDDPVQSIRSILNMSYNRYQFRIDLNDNYDMLDIRCAENIEIETENYTHKIKIISFEETELTRRSFRYLVTYYDFNLDNYYNNTIPVCGNLISSSIIGNSNDLIIESFGPNKINGQLGNNSEDINTQSLSFSTDINSRVVASFSNGEIGFSEDLQVGRLLIFDKEDTQLELKQAFVSSIDSNLIKISTNDILMRSNGIRIPELDLFDIKDLVSGDTLQFTLKGDLGVSCSGNVISNDDDSATILLQFGTTGDFRNFDVVEINTPTDTSSRFIFRIDSITENNINGTTNLGLPTPSFNVNRTINYKSRIVFKTKLLNTFDIEEPIVNSTAIVSGYNVASTMSINDIIRMELYLNENDNNTLLKYHRLAERTRIIDNNGIVYRLIDPSHIISERERTDIQQLIKNTVTLTYNNTFKTF